MPLAPVDNENELLLKTAAGDERAFAGLFYAYHNALAEFVLMLTQSQETTEEIIQDIFIKIWQTKSELPQIKSFTSYLFILARNYTLNNLRKAATDRKKQDEYGLHVDRISTVPENDLTNNPAYFTLLEDAIAQLPPQQQKAYLLSKRDGLKHAAIATEMGLSKDSVKKYIQWANQSIAEFVASHKKLLGILIIIGATKQ